MAHTRGGVRLELDNEAAALSITDDHGQGPLDLAALFPDRPSAPLVVELGTGNGIFLANEAARYTEFNYLGVELDRTFHVKMTKRCAREGLKNVRTLNADAHEVLAERLPEGSVTHLISLFSDPWPKRRHARHRMFGPRMLPLLRRVLAEGGDVQFKTDMAFYFNLAVTAFRADPGWRLDEVARQAPPDPARGETITNFERKAREAGRAIWGLRARPVS